MDFFKSCCFLSLNKYRMLTNFDHTYWMFYNLLYFDAARLEFYKAHNNQVWVRHKSIIKCDLKSPFLNTKNVRKLLLSFKYSISVLIRFRYYRYDWRSKNLGIFFSSLWHIQGHLDYKISEVLAFCAHIFKNNLFRFAS